MLTNILDKVGNTPLVSINLKNRPKIKIFAKLESYNPTGSVKDRAASYIIKQILKQGIINTATTLIESSSRNFGVALAAYSKRHNLNFICVIDKNITPINEALIELHGANIIKITEPDKYESCLLNRIKKVKSIIETTPNVYWINQYENPLNAEAYYNCLGNEICNEAPQGIIDYVFLAVSSGGTIAGVSHKVKERFPNAKIIAVDVFGSVIFGKKPEKRYIPGIGSNMRPEILSHAIIDDVVFVSEIETVKCCRELLQEHFLYLGGSSGSVYAAIKKYFSLNEIENTVNVICIFPDGGERYNSTIYNDNWYEELLEKKRKENPTSSSITEAI